MADGRMKVNIRFWSKHLMSAKRFPWLVVRDNPAHRIGSGIDPKTKLIIGEFRSKPGWRPFVVHRFFGMV